jgi:hypothetical protein
MSTPDLAAWLLADDGPIAEDEAWARSACGRPGEAPAVDGGEHWQWECGDDHVVTPDPAAGESLTCPVCGDYNASLRSVELYPTDSVGPLPTFAVPYAQEIPTTVAGHLIRWDPARVLAECAAKRAVVEEWQAAVAEFEAGPQHYGEEALVNETVMTALGPVVRILAQPYAGRPGWREEWAG